MAPSDADFCSTCHRHDHCPKSVHKSILLDLWTLLVNYILPQLNFLYNFAAKQQGNEYE